MLLIVGLMAGGLCLLLALNTASAANEVARHDLTSNDQSAAAQLVELENEVQASAAPANLAAAAAALGMVPAGNPGFLEIARNGTVRVMGSAAPASVEPVVIPHPAPTATKTTSAAKKDAKKPRTPRMPSTPRTPRTSRRSTPRPTRRRPRRARPADADQYRGPDHDGPPGRAGPLDDLLPEPDAHTHAGDHPAGRQPMTRFGPPAQPPRRRPAPSGARRQPQRPSAARGPARPVRSAHPSRPARPARPAARRPVRRTRRNLRLGALHGRLRFGFAAVCTLLLVIGGRLVQLQGLDGSKYAAGAAAQRVFTMTLHSIRGQIVDRNGTPLAYTSTAQDITADPQQIKAAASAQRKLTGRDDLVATYATELAPLVGVRARPLAKLLTGPGQYALVATALSPVAAEKISALGLAGIYTQPTTQRQYPGRTTAANVLGTVHADGSGAAGVESEYNHLLAGKDGSVTYSVDNMGNVNPASSTVTDPARNGGTIRLTLDQSLQYTAQQYLDTAVRESGARGAEMVVLDAHTAQVLAMASSDTFDAANPNTIKPDVPMNPPVMSAFEPGSVQKSITFAAALQNHLIKPNTVISVPPRIGMGGVTVADAWYHPTERFTATGILAESSNVGTLKVAQRLGPKVWDSYEKKFGVGQKTGIELPGESSGYLPPMKDWSASSFANLPFGQGESMTVLQLASIYQTFANNGVRVPPRIIQSVTAPDGSVTDTRRPGGHPGRLGEDGGHPAHDARVGHVARRHRHQGGRARLPGGRQDRHRAAARPQPRRRLFQLDELGHLRRDAACGRSAVRGRDHGRQPGPWGRGRRRRRAAVPPDRDLRDRARAHPADGLAVQARAAAGV